MKKKIETYRGAGFSLVKTLVLAGVVSIAAFTQSARAFNAVNAYINATNGTTVVVNTTTNNVNVVSPATTNTFNLSVTMGSQVNTNLWPACPIQIHQSVFTASRWVTYQDQFALNGAGTTAYVKRYAGSVDGSHWQTNPCPLVITETPAGTANVEMATNWDTGGFQYVALFTEENPNATAVTNQFIGTGFNGGL